MSKSKELRDCPFCGHDPCFGMIIVRDERGNLVKDTRSPTVVVCTFCGAHGPRSNDLADAENRWMGRDVDVAWDKRKSND